MTSVMMVSFPYILFEWTDLLRDRIWFQAVWNANFMHRRHQVPPRHWGSHGYSNYLWYKIWTLIRLPFVSGVASWNGYPRPRARKLGFPFPSLSICGLALQPWAFLAPFLWWWALTFLFSLFYLKKLYLVGCAVACRVWPLATSHSARVLLFNVL